MANNVWSDEHTEIARRLIGMGARNHEFLAAINRTKSAAHSRISYVDNPNCRDKAATRARRYRESAKHSGDHVSQHRAKSAGFIPEHVIADAVRRADAPRTLTAWFCGDPAPGQSALDRREQRA